MENSLRGFHGWEVSRFDPERVVIGTLGRRTGASSVTYGSPEEGTSAHARNASERRVRLLRTDAAGSAVPSNSRVT